MEYWYARWEEKWKTSGEINNPKVPSSFVKKNGKLLYSSVGGNLENTLTPKPK
jgi:hypothetical protein